MSKKFVLGLFFTFATIFTSQIWSQESVRATFYANKFQNRKTSSGERYLMSGYTCAHKSLPFGTYLLVKNPDNGKEVIVKVNDRMPGKNRLDLSLAAAKDLDIVRSGSKNVDITILDENALAMRRNELLVDNN